MISYSPLVNTLKKKKMDIAGLQSALGKKDDFLKRCLNEKRYISMKTIDEICNVLNCSISEVIKWEEGPQALNKVEKHVRVNWDLLIEKLQSVGFTLQEESKRLGHSSGWLSNIKCRGELSKATLRDICIKHEFDYESLVK